VPTRTSTSTVDLEVVIPALNEESRIGPVTEALTAYLADAPWRCRVTVVDNGSVDRTAEVVDRADHHGVDVRVLGCGRAGKGAAVRAGVLASDSRYVGFTDSDLSTPVETLGPVMARLLDGGRFVMGSRRIVGASYVATQPMGRRIGSRVFRSLSADITGGIEDTQCGFKFFESMAAKALFSQCELDGFAFDLEVIGLARRAGLAIDEVPVQWSDDAGGSSFSILTHGASAFRDLQRARDRVRRPSDRVVAGLALMG
jgi:glycosyltransferase involved in cell wall biosynthesis